jgi:hypothetical protein
MSKPWDKLRVQPPVLPMSEGAWATTPSLGAPVNVGFSHAGGGSCLVTFSHLDQHADIRLQFRECRQIAEFLIELADQLEAQ